VIDTASSASPLEQPVVGVCAYTLIPPQANTIVGLYRVKIVCSIPITGLY